jgi:two-component system response regulator HydG
MAKPHVLVVDDRENMVHLIEKVLRRDATTHAAMSGGQALKALESNPVSAVICDLRMPDMSGIDVLRACKRLQPGAEFILMTAYASVPTAIEAMREGAYDYVTKPFDPEHLRAVVLRALNRSAVDADGKVDAAASSEQTEVLPGLIGRTAIMRQLGAHVQRVAASDATVLILGETGTGKERIARAVHALSARARERMVAVNCAAIPAELLESELFGYTRGAFTGAARDRTGLFEEADRGVLLLDEIADMRLSLQAKLTRAVEERSIRRLGDSRERSVNVRLVAATHRDLEAMVRAGAFRDDLWYRLNVAVIRVPALRERKEDVELLARHFLREVSSRAPSGQKVGLTDAAMEALTNYAWPGNVRQLRAAIERASIEVQGSMIDLEHLPPEITADASPDLAANLVAMKWQEAIEVGRREAGRRYLQAVIKKHQGRVADAAAYAGVERESFYRLLRKYGVKSDGSLDES